MAEGEKEKAMNEKNKAKRDMETASKKGLEIESMKNKLVLECEEMKEQLEELKQETGNVLVLGMDLEY